MARTTKQALRALKKGPFTGPLSFNTRSEAAKKREAAKMKRAAKRSIRETKSLAKNIVRGTLKTVATVVTLGGVQLGAKVAQVKAKKRAAKRKKPLGLNKRGKKAFKGKTFRK